MKPEDGEHCCDPFSNSNDQSIYKLAPSKEWQHWGFPANATDGFVGDPKLHELNVGDTKYPFDPSAVVCVCVWGGGGWGGVRRVG
jgi:hypothetical protein